MSRPRQQQQEPFPRGHMRDINGAPEFFAPIEENAVIEPLLLDGELEGVQVDGLQLGGH